ncbi:TetR/AcrR family transcriptional regulator [Roseospira goensis]|uniref:TetR/AcrR family transcriptional repressor of nem operon n=1 Tax=Roseospira goensis TaxID=391922 RepID=A0A7W6S164_9PROT|nr:TetR/AcrR family transcriptional regulator [Roseospira goensis]MBB4286329.1 TetR/AcrR family transcriptional repressor of nem operon [Roseospira goensis]
MARPRGFDTDAVLDRAMDAFWRQGYGNTSLPDLLDVMGISRSSFYETFGGKRALFEASLRRYEARVTSRIMRALEQPGPIRTVMERLLADMVTRTLAGEGRGCMMCNTAVELAPHDPDLRAWLAGSFEGVERALAVRLAQARDAGELAADADPVALARTFVALFNGLRVIAKARPERAVLDDIARSALRLLD